jgi:hypothetical protein
MPKQRRKEQRMIRCRHPRTLGLFLGLSLLAGCGGSQNQNATLIPNEASTSAAVRSTIASGPQAPDLLYVSDRKDESIGVYAFAAGKPRGRIAGIRADGLCSDIRGNVFVLNGNRVLEYAHGGTRTIAVLQNPLGGARCAADPITGDLAISSARGLTVFANAKGQGRPFAARRNERFGSVAYDGAGNLFVATPRALRELPKGTAQLRQIGLNGATAPISDIAWDGHNLAVATENGATAPATISRYSVGNGRPELVDALPLQNAGRPAQIAIFGGKLIALGAAGVSFYTYPQGGRPAMLLADAREPQSMTISRASAPKFSITTYHYDNYRTGWNNDETSLTYQSVNSSSFGLLDTVSLDDQVDAQPLVVPNETITTGSSSREHDVVYVATESDTVYAIDADSGDILLQQSLGSPVSYPLGCSNNGPNVGIDSTPVVDLSANVMYVIAYVSQSNVPVYYLHELSLSSLKDVVTPVVVSASHTLTNGTLYPFQAVYQRQRPALLEANGNVYAAFGSFCDYVGSNSRGWLLGWQAGSLTPLQANRLNDSLYTSPDHFFLTAIWMSGYGPAADASGNVYFVTGNSDYSGTTYNGVTNVAESVVKVTPDLSTMLGIFTPANESYLDKVDGDFGSGGVLLVPALSKIPVAAAAGKDGEMYLMNQDNLGGYSTKGNHVLDQVSIGGCWCGQSYYAVKKHQYIVASGGSSVTVWRVHGGKRPKLKLSGTSPYLSGGQDPGFFTTVSSDAKGGNAIVWALARPSYVPGPMSLYAFAAQENTSSGQLETLYQNASAGYWSSSGGNANLVPVVANGKVYVASYEQLSIFGLTSSKNGAKALHHGAAPVRFGGPNEVTGTLTSKNGSLLTLRTRAGSNVVVDDTLAERSQRTGDLVIGEPFSATGRYDGQRVLHARFMLRAKPSTAVWPPDR